MNLMTIRNRRHRGDHTHWREKTYLMTDQEADCCSDPEWIHDALQAHRKIQHRPSSGVHFPREI